MEFPASVPDSLPTSRRKLLTALGALAAAGLAGHSLLAAAATVPAERPERLLLPGVRFENDQGRPLGLEDFRGRVVLLNLWATWCVPCRKEMPAVDRLQKQLGGPGFEVVAVSIDRSPEDVREFYRKFGIKSLAHYIDRSSDIIGTLRAIGLPTTVLVDREGREIWRVTGPAEWDGPQWVAAIRKHVAAGKKP